MSFTCIVHVRNAHVMVLVARSSMFFLSCVCGGQSSSQLFKVHVFREERTMKTGGGSIFSNFGRFCSCSCLLLCVRSCRPVLRSLNHWNVIWFSFKTCHFCRCQNSQYTIYSASVTTNYQGLLPFAIGLYGIFITNSCHPQRFILDGNLWFFLNNPVLLENHVQNMMVHI